jgi:hypothetical protein
MRTFANYVDNDGAPKKRPRKMMLGNQQSSSMSKPTSHIEDESCTASDITLRNCNPLNRLCEKLLEWRILPDLAGSNRPSVRAARVPPAIDVHVPLVFKNYVEYVEIWEPLLLAEIKANLLSNAFSLPMERSVVVELSSNGPSSSSSALASLTLTFLPSDNTATTR